MGSVILESHIPKNRNSQIRTQPGSPKACFFGVPADLYPGQPAHSSSVPLQAGSGWPCGELHIGHKDKGLLFLQSVVAMVTEAAQGTHE